jgi:hypothetical protein
LKEPIYDPPKTSFMSHPTEQFESIERPAVMLDEMLGALTQVGPASVVRVAECPTVSRFMRERGVDMPPGHGLMIQGDLARDAIMMMRGVAEIFEDQIPGMVKFDDYYHVVQMASQWGPVAFVKNFKYFTTYPLAVFLEQDLPERPVTWPEGTSPLLFQGRARRYLKNLMSQRRDRRGRQNDRHLRFWWSLFQGAKRAAAEARPEVVHAACVKHRDILTRSPPRQTWFDQHERDLLQMKIWKGLRVKDVLEQPSSNASFSSTIRGARFGPRSKGGGAETIRERVIDDSPEIAFRSRSSGSTIRPANSRNRAR